MNEKSDFNDQLFEKRRDEQDDTFINMDEGCFVIEKKEEFLICYVVDYSGNSHGLFSTDKNNYEVGNENPGSFNTAYSILNFYLKDDKKAQILHFQFTRNVIAKLNGIRIVIPAGAIKFWIENLAIKV